MSFGTWENYRRLIASFVREAKPQTLTSVRRRPHDRREFHDYFVTHLPSSSLHPDSRRSTGLAHKFPRKDSTPHKPDGSSAAALHPTQSRDTTTVRVPLRSARHHFGAAVSRGSRPYNEDTHQAGVINLPAFAKKPPISLQLDKKRFEATSAQGESGDPQVFYFSVFDGHGGVECSDFLREQLHKYIEESANRFDLHSTLRSGRPAGMQAGREYDADTVQKGKDALKAIDTSNRAESEPLSTQSPQIQAADTEAIASLEKSLVKSWNSLVGGYYRRFKPNYFSIYNKSASGIESGTTIEEVMMYSFLKADYDFVAAQAAKRGEEKDLVRAERPLNDGDILGAPNRISSHVGGEKQFKGGSTASLALVSTPTPVPFWHPASTSTLLIAHVGDTRVLLSSTATGNAIPLTTNHHPSSPIEATRLRRYAATFITDSFGEERTISGLANTRAFGDMASKRIGVSAEPEFTRIEIQPAEYAFMVLVSDGVSGTLTDQEIVDIVKEAKTADEAAKNVIGFATEVSQDGDNATCLVVRLGGWERRQEGGVGSLGTKEGRDFKRNAASDPRSKRM